MNYFAYGSNLDLKQMAQRCPQSNLIGKASLQGYKIAFTKYSSGWDSGVADIIRAEDSEVWGLLYEVTEDDLKRLDGYEGHPDYYLRIVVSVVNEKGDSVEVYTYKVVDKVDLVPPSEEYLGIIKDAAKKYNFPDKYKRQLDQVECK